MIIPDIRKYYEIYGYDPIPLLKNDKAIKLSNWPYREISDLWEEAEEFGGYQNIGIRTGNGVAVLDADCPQTLRIIQQHLFYLGIGQEVYPLVSTKDAGNGHVYLHVSDLPIIGNRIQLKEPLVGDFRYGAGSYVVAPPSVVERVSYKCISGRWEYLPKIEYDDLALLLGQPINMHLDGLVEKPPVPLLRRKVPSKVWSLFNQLAEAPKGKPIDQYRSRSESEMGIICDLILCGRNYKDVVRLFTKMKPGHFINHPNRYQYLERSWIKAVDYIGRQPSRPEIAQFYHRVDQILWKHDPDRAVYQGLLSIAWQFAVLEPAASHRDLQLFSGVGSRNTVMNSLNRLERELWLISRVQCEDKSNTSIWRINDPGQICTSSHTVTNQKVVELVSIGSCLSIELENALWAYLRGSCRQVYRSLAEVNCPKTLDDLALWLDKHPRTVRRTLAKLVEYQLAIEVEENRWQLGNRKLASVAKELDIASLVQKRRDAVDAERKSYRPIFQNVRRKVRSDDE